VKQPSQDKGSGVLLRRKYQSVIRKLEFPDADQYGFRMNSVVSKRGVSEHTHRAVQFQM